MFEISMNPYMDRIEFEGTLEEAKAAADEMITYNQQDIIIWEDGRRITMRKYWGCDPSEEDDDEDIIPIGDGFYAEWVDFHEEVPEVKNDYYWIDLYSTEFFTLYRGELDENGEKDRDTEEEILSCRYDAIGVVDVTPHDDEAREENWRKIDSYIIEQLGFLPDYEIN